MGRWTGRGKGRGAGQPSVPGIGGTGAGGGRRASQPSVPGMGGIGAGGGRSAGQPSVPGIGGIGAGGGRSASQPSVPGIGGIGAGGGRSASQPTITASAGGWIGMGKGRGGGQPSIVAGAWISISRTPSVAEDAPSNLDDPEGNYVFALEIDGVEIAHFMECSGLKTTTEVFEIQEGGMNDRVHKVPGQSKWENITLRYGVTSDTSLLGWRNEILQDQFQEGGRRNGSIIIKNNQMQVVRRYNFKAAWPVSWEGPSLSASGSELAVEMLEIAHHGIEIT